MPELRQPVEKLPLAARKNWRDEYENKRVEEEEKLSKYLGTAWTFKADPNLLFAYAEPDSYGANSPGSCAFSYFEGAVSRIKDFVDESRHGAAGAEEINTLASSHVLTLLPDLTGKVSYGDVVIADGELRIVFSEKNLGSNVYYCLDKLDRALNDASEAAGTTLSYAARHSIKADYDEQAKELAEKIGAQLHDKIKLVPNFEENFTALKNSKKTRDDWQGNLGGFTFSYLDSVLYRMSYEKFIEDDLLREGFAEGVPKGEIQFKVVEKLSGKGSSYNGVRLEDGTLVVETTPENFGSNVTYASEKLVDLL